MSAEETFEIRPQRVRVYSDPRCDRCNTELEFHRWPTQDDPNPAPDDEAPWYDYAMKVLLRGSYGGYIDDSQPTYDLCARCSHALFTFLNQQDDDPYAGDAEWAVEGRRRIFGEESE